MKENSPEHQILCQLIGPDLDHYWFFHQCQRFYSFPESIIELIQTNQPSLEAIDLFGVVSKQQQPFHRVAALVCVVLKWPMSVDFFVDCVKQGACFADEIASAALFAGKTDLFFSLMPEFLSNRIVLTTQQWFEVFNAACTHRLEVVQYVLHWFNWHQVALCLNQYESSDPFYAAASFGRLDVLRALCIGLRIGSIIDENSPYEDLMRNAFFGALECGHLPCADYVMTLYQQKEDLFLIQELKSDVYDVFSMIGEHSSMTVCEWLIALSCDNRIIQGFTNTGWCLTLIGAIKKGRLTFIQQLFERVPDQIQAMLSDDGSFAPFCTAITEQQTEILFILMQASSDDLMTEMLYCCDARSNLTFDHIQYLKSLQHRNGVDNRSCLFRYLGVDLSTWLSEQHGPYFYDNFPSQVLLFLQEKDGSPIKWSECVGFFRSIAPSYRVSVLTTLLKYLEWDHSLLKTIRAFNWSLSDLFPAVLFAKGERLLKPMLDEYANDILRENLVYKLLDVACSMGLKAVLHVAQVFKSSFDWRVFAMRIQRLESRAFEITVCFGQIELLQYWLRLFECMNQNYANRILSDERIRLVFFLAMNAGQLDSMNALMALHSSPSLMLEQERVENEGRFNKAFMRLGQHGFDDVFKWFQQRALSDARIQDVLTEQLHYVLKGAVLSGHVHLVHHIIEACSSVHYERMLAGDDKLCHPLSIAISRANASIFNALLGICPESLLLNLLAYDGSEKESDYNLQSVLIEWPSCTVGRDQLSSKLILLSEKTAAERRALPLDSRRIQALILDQLLRVDPNDVDLSPERVDLYCAMLLQIIRFNHDELNAHINALLSMDAVKGQLLRTTIENGQTLAHMMVCYHHESGIQCLLKDHRDFLIQLWVPDGYGRRPNQLIASFDSTPNWLMRALRAELANATQQCVDQSSDVQSAERFLQTFVGEWVASLQRWIVLNRESQDQSLSAFLNGVLKAEMLFPKSLQSHIHQMSALNKLIFFDVCGDLTKTTLCELLRLAKGSLPRDPRGLFFSSKAEPALLSSIQRVVDFEGRKPESANLSDDAICCLKRILLDYEQGFLPTNNAVVTLTLVHKLRSFPAMRPWFPRAKTTIYIDEIEPKHYGNCLNELIEMLSSTVLHPVEKESMESIIIPGLRRLIEHEDLEVQNISAQTAPVYYINGTLPFHTEHDVKGNVGHCRMTIRRMLGHLFVAMKVAAHQKFEAIFFEKLANGACLEGRATDVLNWAASLHELISFEALMNHCLNQELQPYLKVMFNADLSDEPDVNYITRFIMARYAKTLCCVDNTYAPLGTLTAEGIKQYLITIFGFSPDVDNAKKMRFD